MPKPSDLLDVALVSGQASCLALGCFWWAGPWGRLTAALAALVASALLVLHARAVARTSLRSAPG